MQHITFKIQKTSVDIISINSQNKDSLQNSYQPKIKILKQSHKCPNRGQKYLHIIEDI